MIYIQFVFQGTLKILFSYTDNVKNDTKYMQAHLELVCKISWFNFQAI